MWSLYIEHDVVCLLPCLLVYYIDNDIIHLRHASFTTATDSSLTTQTVRCKSTAQLATEVRYM